MKILKSHWKNDKQSCKLVGILYFCIVNITWLNYVKTKNIRYISKMES